MKLEIAFMDKAIYNVSFDLALKKYDSLYQWEWSGDWEYDLRDEAIEIINKMTNVELLQLLDRTL